MSRGLKIGMKSVGRWVHSFLFNFFMFIFGLVSFWGFLYVTSFVFTPKWARAADRVEVHRGYTSDEILNGLNPYNRVLGRGPASYIPNDELIIAPFEDDSFIDQLLVEDDKGVLKHIKAQIEFWQEREEYARNWNLESTGLYPEVAADTKVNFLTKQSLRYFDKRISGEIRSAEEGSALHTVGKVQKALKPNTTVNVAPNYRLRFKGRVMEGRVYMVVENPYVDNFLANFRVTGDIDLEVKKHFKTWDLRTRLDYQVDDGLYIATITKPITNRWRTNFSTTQNDDKMMFSDDSNQKFELAFSMPW